MSANEASGARTRVYVAFDVDSDLRHYRGMQAWNADHGFDFELHSAHDLTSIQVDSNWETLKRSLREQITTHKAFILLVGEQTKHCYKYLELEIEIALKTKVPILVVNLRNRRARDRERCPALLHDETALHIIYDPVVVGHALCNWPAVHEKLVEQDRTGPRGYGTEVYFKLGRICATTPL